VIKQLLQVFYPQNANITVSISFDNRYLNYGKILLNSLLKNSPNVNIVVLAINVSQQDLAGYEKLENIKIICEQKEFVHPYEQRLYVTTRRIFLINQLREDDSVENLLQLDADTIINKNLNRLATLYNQGDFLIFARPTMKHEALRLTMNVLGLANSTAAKLLTQEWIRQLWQILETPQDSKYIDQLTLWKAYEKIAQQEALKLVNLDSPWIGQSNQSVIRTFYATKDNKSDQKLLKQLNKFAEQNLAEVPSNAPAKPQEIPINLTRQLLEKNFEQVKFNYQ
jgi:Glycosyl transferase family 8